MLAIEFIATILSQGIPESKLMVDIGSTSMHGGIVGHNEGSVFKPQMCASQAGLTMPETLIITDRPESPFPVGNRSLASSRT